ncbi:DUF4956 domain-containing protein [Pelagibacteraceae bacterium]|jgi:hypothetical protein|nr:DUF4956 domain-containing protein [Pelagibacteraceae bacterium]|tara:strand:- start:3909 stop:4541 length:633 start_codon:yes stop_codon:yes gene_type:complete
MINIFDNLDKIFIIFFLILISVSIRILLQLLGQRWIMTTAHTSTLVLLPILTYIITKVISGNIALSLGMVGALSIVRFRNPVRSPLELSVYFGAITMGIAASVHILWLVFLVGSISLATITLLLANYISFKLCKKSFFTTSFSEGNTLSTLDIKSSKSIKMLDKNINLTFKHVANNEYHYILTSNNYQTLVDTQELFINDRNIISYQINK